MGYSFKGSLTISCLSDSFDSERRTDFRQLKAALITFKICLNLWLSHEISRIVFFISVLFVILLDLACEDSLEGVSHP